MFWDHHRTMAPVCVSCYWRDQMFELDFGNLLDEVGEVNVAINASLKQIQAAYWKALKRTKATMRNQGARRMREAIGLRKLKRAKSRFQVYTRSPAKNGESMGVLTVWMGLNPMKVHDLKGRIKKVKRKHGVGAAIFRDVTYPKSWKARLGGKQTQTIYHRVGTRLRVQNYEVEVLLDDFSQDITDDTLAKFKQHLDTALRSHTLKYARQHSDRDFFR